MAVILRETNMYAIKATLRKSRKEGTPGYIVFRIRNKEGAERIFASGISSTEDEFTTVHKNFVLRGLKCLYDIIEKFHSSGEPYNIDDISDKFRMRLGCGINDIDISNFSVNRRIVSVGKPFNKWMYSARAKEEMYFDVNNMLSVNTLTIFIDSLLETSESTFRSGTYSNYRSAKNALREYIDTLPDNRTAIDCEFVHGFSDWLKSQKLSESTVSFYLRMLRAILNKAKERGLTEVSSRWFSGLINASSPDISENQGKNLSKEEINRIANTYLEPGSLMDFSRDLFMFSFYCRGMEQFDILNLTIDNIHGDLIIYNKRLTGKQQVVRIEPPTRKILNKYISNSDGHIFSELSKYTSSREYVNASRVTSGALIKLGEQLNLHIPLTFSAARKTWVEMTRDSNLASMMLS